jgi:hypothetical protein
MNIFLKKASGLLTALTVIAVLAAGCSNPAGSDGNGTPGPSSLPALPEDVDYVDDDTGAAALLGAMGTDFAAVFDTVEGVIVTAAISDNWSVTDTTTIPGMKITGSGSYSEDGPDGMPQKGSKYTFSSNQNVKAEVTAEINEGDTVFYGGYTTINMKENGSATIKSINEETQAATVALDFSYTESYTYALTLSNEETDTGGKVILDATRKGSFKGDVSDVMDLDDIDLSELALIETYSGFLRVYGTGDEVVKEVLITNQATFEEAMAYFSSEP